MAITTTNGKMAVMVYGNVWEPPMPIVDTGTFGQDDKQQFIWGFPEVLWSSLVAGVFVRIVGEAWRLSGNGGLAGCLFWGVVRCI
jgi:hypothetical protein